MLKLHLLDRNAVSLIKESVAGKPSNGDHIGWLSQLRRLDNRKNTVSALPSIWEGQVGRREVVHEKQKTLEKESLAVKRFYRHARTDYDFLLNDQSETSIVLSGETELDGRDYEKLIITTQSELYSPLNLKDANIWKDSFIEQVRELGIALTHPVVIFCLSTLYGCLEARKVINPKGNPEKRNSHNALTDILSISRVEFIRLRLLSLAGSKKVSVKFITFDSNLSYMIRELQPEGISIARGNSARVKFSYVPTKKIFPNLSQPDYDELMNQLISEQHP